MLDITLAGALAAGLLSFLSPCILPIVPFYLSYLAGAGMDQIASEAGLAPGTRRRAVLASLAFAAGIITIFVGLGLAASAFGQALRAYFDVLRWLAAAVLLAMGLHCLGVLRIGILYRQLRAGGGGPAEGIPGAYVIGLAFAFGWTPCVGPVLAAILFMAAGSDPVQGGMLLFVYGAGMTAPFVLAAFLVEPFMRWLPRFRHHLGRIEKAMGALLVLFALLIVTGSVTLIAGWMLDHIPWFSIIG